MTNKGYGRNGKILDKIVNNFSDRACISKFFRSLDMSSYVDRYILFEFIRRYKNDKNIEEYTDNYIDIIHDITELDNLLVSQKVSERLNELDEIVERGKKN